MLTTSTNAYFNDLFCIGWGIAIIVVCLVFVLLAARSGH